MEGDLALGDMSLMSDQATGSALAVPGSLPPGWPFDGLVKLSHRRFLDI